MFCNINDFIRSAVFSCLMIIITIFYSFICILARPLPFRYRYHLVTIYTQVIIGLLKIICHVNYTIEGMKNIPKNRNGIIFSKHQSLWETFFLQGFFSQSAIILKRELLWIPFFGWGLATIDPISINRSAKKSAMNQLIQEGKKRLDAGRWILVFPEGTRTPPGVVGHYHVGGALLATKTGYPILPIAHNAGLCWPKRSFIKKPGMIRIVIGPLIETKDRDAREVLDEAKTWIETATTTLLEPVQNLH